MIREEAIKWLEELDHYPTVKEMIEAWGGGTITILLNSNDIIIDDGTIILVGATNPNLQKLIDGAVKIS
jgi:hypothetical protein